MRCNAAPTATRAPARAAAVRAMAGSSPAVAVERRFTRESCCRLLQRAVPRRRCPLDAAASGAPLRADRHRWNGARLAPNSAHVSMLARASLTRDPPLAGVSAHGAAQGPRAGIRRRQRVRDRCGARCCFCRQRLPDIALRRMRGGAGASRRPFSVG